MKRLLTRKLIPILIAALILAFVDMSQSLQTKVIGRQLNQKIQLGLDLQGGTQLDYKIDLRKVEAGDQPAIIQGITEVINRRVNNLGVSEPNIYTSQIADEVHVIVELAGIKDMEEAKKRVGKTIQLEFKESVEALPEEKKAEIMTQGEKALARIKAGEELILIGNEEILSSPGKVEFDDASQAFKPSEKIESDELKSTLANLKDGELSGLFEGSYGDFATAQGFMEKTGFFIVKRFGTETSEVEKDIEKSAEVRHVVISYAGSAGADTGVVRTKEEAKARAQEVLRKLEEEKGAASATASALFAALAKTYSDEPAAEQTGGLLIEPVREAINYYDPTFSKAALELKTGEVSDIVETPFGFHIIKSEKTVEAHKETVQETSYKYQALFYSTVADGWKETGLTGEHFVRADVVANEYGQAMVSIKFNDAGKKLFGEITGRNIGKPVAIFVGGDLISSPNVNEAILAGEAVITGNFTVEEANNLARDLNTGAIPAPIVLAGQQSIGASLGAVALDQSIYAGLIGVAILAVGMIAYYGFSGLLAVLALGIYALILFFLIKIELPFGLSFVLALVIYCLLISMILKNEDSGWDKLIAFFVASFVFFFIMFLLSTAVVLTLAGIAGVILSIGMAVDANILIFERIKEEVASGKQMQQAIAIGFERAWSSIRDSNFSSLITCAILVYFGTSIIKGFAINLAAGILVSMFTAITITRAFLDIAAASERGKKLLLWGLQSHTSRPHIQVISRAKLWFWISGTLTVVSIVAGIVFGPKFGLDFTGGTMMEIKVNETVTAQDISSALSEADETVETDLSHASVLPSENHNFILRTKSITNEEHDIILAKFREKFGEVEESRFTVVGPVIGSALKSKALTALIFTSLMIVLYIAFAFRHVPKAVSPWRFGICAIIALLHDVIITIGVFFVLGKFLNVEMDALFVTALLTVMGFSVHDTIVVFDRIRENLLLARRDTPFDEIANNALNQTMARSLNTSISTLITITALFILGPQSIRYFVFALLVGIIVGTYSSIFTASPLLCVWKKWADRRRM